MNDVTTTYRVDILSKGLLPFSMSWPLKKAGWPTDAALAAFVEKVSAANDFDIQGAEIVRQHNGDVLATFGTAV